MTPAQQEVADRLQAIALAASHRELDTCVELVRTRRALRQARRRSRVLFALGLLLGVLSFVVGVLS
jgi:hypothetical protein